MSLLSCFLFFFSSASHLTSQTCLKTGKKEESSMEASDNGTVVTCEYPLPRLSNFHRLNDVGALLEQRRMKNYLRAKRQLQCMS